MLDPSPCFAYSKKKKKKKAQVSSIANGKVDTIPNSGHTGRDPQRMLATAFSEWGLNVDLNGYVILWRTLTTNQVWWHAAVIPEEVKAGGQEWGHPQLQGVGNQLRLQNKNQHRSKNTASQRSNPTDMHTVSVTFFKKATGNVNQYITNLEYGRCSYLWAEGTTGPRKLYWILDQIYKTERLHVLFACLSVSLSPQL